VGRKIILNDTSERSDRRDAARVLFHARARYRRLDATFILAGMLEMGWHDLHCVARLKPGVTLAQAQQAMAALSLRVSAEHVNPPRSAVVSPLREELAGKTYTSLLVLLGAACDSPADCVRQPGESADVARSSAPPRSGRACGSRRNSREINFAILNREPGLAGLGAIAGIALALPFMQFLNTLVPDTMSAVRLTLDWRVLAFSAAIAIAAGLTFGWFPAVGLSRLVLQEGLRDGGRGSAGGRSHRFQHSLIVVETALAVVLLTSCGLLLQTFQRCEKRILVSAAKSSLRLSRLCSAIGTSTSESLSSMRSWKRFARFPVS
jgi:hypothetical protein